MVGSPNAARYVYQGFGNEPGGVAEGITQSLNAAFEELGAPALPADLGGGSDHAQFDRAGIPTGGVFSGLSPCQRLSRDFRRRRQRASRSVLSPGLR